MFCIPLLHRQDHPNTLLFLIFLINLLGYFCAAFPQSFFKEVVVIEVILKVLFEVIYLDTDRDELNKK